MNRKKLLRIEDFTYPNYKQKKKSPSLKVVDFSIFDKKRYRKRLCNFLRSYFVKRPQFYTTLQYQEEDFARMQLHKIFLKTIALNRLTCQSTSFFRNRDKSTSFAVSERLSMLKYSVRGLLYDPLRSSTVLQKVSSYTYLFLFYKYIIFFIDGRYKHHVKGQRKAKAELFHKERLTHFSHLISQKQISKFMMLFKSSYVKETSSKTKKRIVRLSRLLCLYKKYDRKIRSRSTSRYFFTSLKSKDSKSYRFKQFSIFDLSRDSQRAIRGFSYHRFHYEERPNIFWCSTYRTNYTIIRPLLTFLRGTVTRACTEARLPLYPDLSNFQIKYSRNRIRKQIIPAIKVLLNPKMEKALFQFSELSLMH